MIYLDLDGVLCDLESTVIRLAGHDPDTVAERPFGLGNILPGANKDFWRLLKEAGLAEQFASLPWLPWGRDVLAACRSADPNVVIATSTGPDETGLVGKGKRLWLQREVPGIPYVFISRKGELAGDDAVLIDDQMRNVAEFRETSRPAIPFPRYLDPHPAERIWSWVREVLPVELHAALGGRTLPAGTAACVAALLGQARLDHATEADLQNAVADVLAGAGIPHDRERTLDASCRPDFLVGDHVAVECKIRRRQGAREILRQLERYCRHDQVRALVFVTAMTFPVPDTIAGVPVRTVRVGLAWL